MMDIQYQVRIVKMMMTIGHYQTLSYPVLSSAMCNGDLHREVQDLVLQFMDDLKMSDFLNKGHISTLLYLIFCCLVKQNQPNKNIV